MRVACKAVMVSLMAADYSAMGVDTATEFESESDAEGRVCALKMRKQVKAIQRF